MTKTCPRLIDLWPGEYGSGIVMCNKLIVDPKQTYCDDCEAELHGITVADRTLDQTYRDKSE